MTRPRQVRLGGRELGERDELAAEAVRLERAEYLRRRAELAPVPPLLERSPKSETVWQGEVVRLAERLGWWVYHPKLSKWSQRGWLDLSMLHEQRGLALFVELKDDDGTLTEPQVRCIERLEAAGLAWAVWRPWHGLERVAAVLQGMR